MSLIAEAVRDCGDSWPLVDEHLAEDRPCEGSKYHSPTPLLTYQIYLSRVVDTAMSRVPDPARQSEEPVSLCATCVDNLHTFVRLMHAHDGGLLWLVRREFGNKIRDLGMAAWDFHVESEKSSA